MRSDYTDVLTRMYDEYRTRIIAIAEQGKTNGSFRKSTDAQAVAYLLVGGMDGLYIQSRLSPPKKPENVIEQAMQTVTEGIRSR